MIKNSQKVLSYRKNRKKTLLKSSKKWSKNSKKVLKDSKK
jgi:hypothetical protein